LESLYEKNKHITSILAPETLECACCNLKVSSVDHDCQKFMCNRCGEVSTIAEALKKHEQERRKDTI
jgi:hypothetical protein